MTSTTSQPHPLLLLLLSFLSLLIITFSASDDPSSVAGCSVSDMCGSVNISYPFWRRSDGPPSSSSSAVHCGYPGFGIACEEGRHPILRTDSGRYYNVVDIDYAGRTINLTDAELSGCQRVRRNVTFSSSLSYTSADANLTFFLNCSVDGLLPDFLQQHAIPCLGYDRKSSFVFPSTGVPAEISTSRCEDVVLAPVLLDHIRDSAPDVIEALNYGFQLSWIAGAPEGCGECERSGRRCGFNQTSGSGLCFCPDGTLAGNCGGAEPKFLSLGFTADLVTDEESRARPTGSLISCIVGS